jgi:hypothetical protein
MKNKKVKEQVPDNVWWLRVETNSYTEVTRQADPEEKWDGTFDSISPKNMTIVNRKFLINKTSDIIRKLSEINELNELKISLPGEKKELINRYFLMIPRN